MFRPCNNIFDLYVNLYADVIVVAAAEEEEVLVVEDEALVEEEGVCAEGEEGEVMEIGEMFTAGRTGCRIRCLQQRGNVSCVVALLTSQNYFIAQPLP